MIKKQVKKITEKLVEESFDEGRILESRVTKAIKALKTLPLSEGIFALSQYLKLLKRKEREHTMFIETAFPLSSSEINRMKKVIDKKIKITKVKLSVNTEILGGFKLKIGDEVWDESVLGKIKQVKDRIMYHE